MSCYFFRKKEFSTAISLLLLCGLILRLFVASDGYLHDWDEQFHALVAKNMLAHPFTPTLYEHPVLPYDFSNWSSNHIWLHKQPLSLWGMAIGIKIFGISEWSIRIPTVLLSCFAIWLTYAIGKSLFDRKIAFIAAFLHTIHGYTIELTGGRVTTDHIDIYFLTFIELGIYLSVLSAQKPNKRYFDIFIGIAIGLAVLTKWLPALIVLPVWILLQLDKQNSLSRIISGLFIISTVALIVFLPWQLYIHSAFPNEAQWESNYNRLHITHAVESHSAPFYYHITNLPMLFGELIFIPLLGFLYYAFKKKNTKYLALVTWIMIPLLFFTLVATKMKAYILFTEPAIFLVTAFTIRFLYFHKKKFKQQWVIPLFALLLLLLPIRYSIERVKPFSDKPRNPIATLQLKSLAKEIIDDKAVIFNVSAPIKAMFYGSFTAYPTIPKPFKIKELIQQGYHIYIYNPNKKIRQQYEKIEEINFIKASKTGTTKK